MDRMPHMLRVALPLLLVAAIAVPLLVPVCSMAMCAPEGLVCGPEGGDAHDAAPCHGGGCDTTTLMRHDDADALAATAVELPPVCPAGIVASSDAGLKPVAALSTVDSPTVPPPENPLGVVIRV
ncbi:MAG: hypothetical protein Kow0067_12130 [Coriobacteriia bacterium]